MAQVLFTCPEPFKDALDAYATKLGLSTSAYIRKLIAEDMHYDGPLLVGAGRPQTYANKEARIAAQNERARVARLTAKRLIEAFEHKAHTKDIAAIEAYLRAKGIPID